MSEFIKSVSVLGLHGQFDFSCEFQEGINVIYGRNGTGKTTLLHIIANVLNKDFVRFAVLEFKKITVSFSESDPLVIELEKVAKSPSRRHSHYYVHVNGKRSTKQEICPFTLTPPPNLDRYQQIPKRALGEEEFDYDTDNIPDIQLSSAYFPAFRTAIDAWAINREEEYRLKKHRNLKTDFARSLFGAFVPRLDYPATSEIERDLNEQIRVAIAKVSQADRTYFGNFPRKVLEALSSAEESPETSVNSVFENIEEEIEDLSGRFQRYPIQVESVLSNLSDTIKSVVGTPNTKHLVSLVLNSYRDALREIVSVQDSSFSQVNKYLKSVNLFLENKNLEISQLGLSPSPVMSNRVARSPSIVIQFEGGNSRPMRMTQSLSSGERQIVTLIYATTSMSRQDVILVDEPEISLNVDWQRKLLPEMVEQMPSKQLIVCTHSPIVSAKYRDRMVELKSSRTSENHDILDDWNFDREDLYIDS